MNWKTNKNILFVVILIIAVVLTAIITSIFIPMPANPVQAYAGDFYECGIGEFIRFNGYVFGGSLPYNWSWDFNGDNTPDSYEKNPIYSFNNVKPSLEFANLTVTDGNGQSNTSTAYVYIDVELELGDIIYLEARPYVKELLSIIGHDAWYFVHAAMYIGNDLFIESGDYTLFNDTEIENDLEDIYNRVYTTYKSLDMNDDKLNSLSYIFNLENGVQISHSIKMNSIYDQRGFGKVISANMSQKMKARDFAYSQLGKPYQWLEEGGGASWRANPNITDPTHPYYNWTIPDDPYIDYWYCTEIIWAAYLHQNVQIDPDPVDDPQTEIETIIYSSSRDYFGDELIDISRLPQWIKWRLF